MYAVACVPSVLELDAFGDPLMKVGGLLFIHEKGRVGEENWLKDCSGLSWRWGTYHPSERLIPSSSMDMARNMSGGGAIERPWS